MSADFTIYLVIGLVFLLAGWTKGVVGMGLPVVGMGVLGLLMPTVEAAAILVLPALFTNLWQIYAGPALGALWKRFRWMLLCVCIGTSLGVGFLTAGSSFWPPLALGGVLLFYALLGLLHPRLSVPVHLQSRLSPLVGFLTGALAGATGISVVPSVPYLSAIGLDREELIQALGLTFAVSMVALAVGLGAAGSFSGALLLQSAFGVVPAFVGMSLGRMVRHRLNADRFRIGFFIAMLLIGSVMILRALSHG